MKLTRTDINPKLTQNSTNQTKATNVHEHKQPNALVVANFMASSSVCNTLANIICILKSI